MPFPYHCFTQLTYICEFKFNFKISCYRNEPSLEVTFSCIYISHLENFYLNNLPFRIFSNAKFNFYPSQNASEKWNYLKPSSLLVFSLMVFIYSSWSFIYPFVKYLLDRARLFIFSVLGVNCSLATILISKWAGSRLGRLGINLVSS